MILRYFLKNIILSRRIWFFGILFGLFLLYIGYSQSLAGIQMNRVDKIFYSGQWLATTVLFLFGTVSTAVAQSAIFSSASLPYLFRFSRYSRISYIYDISLAAVIVSLGLSTVLAGAASGIFSLKFGIPVYAVNLALLYAVMGIGACFMIFFALFLVLLSVNYIGTKNVNYIHLVPQMMAYGFGILALTTHIPDVNFYYFIPFNAFLGIFGSYYSGASLLLYGRGSPLSDTYMLACLMLWTLTMALLDFLLLKKLKVANLEEAVQI